MNRVEQLLANYRRHIQMPLRPGLPAAQRVWFAVYPSQDERRLVPMIGDFELATRDAGHQWLAIDFRGQFAAWLGGIDEEERSEWFRHPEDIELYAKNEWKDRLVGFVKSRIDGVQAPEGTVFALSGLMELYDLLHVSELIDAIEPLIPGYLLVFFPGERDNNIYRFLDVRPGWNYLAQPILSDT